MTTVLRALAPLQTHDGPRHAHKSVSAEDQAATLAWAEQEGWLNDRSLPASYGLYNAVILVGKQHTPYMARLEEVPATKFNQNHDDHGRFSSGDGASGTPSFDKVPFNYRVGGPADDKQVFDYKLPTTGGTRRFANQAEVDKKTVGEYKPYSDQLARDLHGAKDPTQANNDATASKISDHINRIANTTPTSSALPHLDAARSMLDTYQSTKKDGMAPSYQKTPLLGAAMAAGRTEGEMWQAIGRVPRVPDFHGEVATAADRARLATPTPNATEADRNRIPTNMSVATEADFNRMPTNIGVATEADRKRRPTNL